MIARVPARTASLIGVPTDVGASARGASMGPEALRVAGLREAILRRGMQVIDRGNLSGPANPCGLRDGGYRHLQEVIEWNRSLHGPVLAELRLRLPIFALPLLGCSAALMVSHSTIVWLAVVLIVVPCCLGLCTTYWRLSVLSRRRFQSFTSWLCSVVGLAQKGA